MRIVFTETETEVLKELRSWAEKKYRIPFEMIDYKTALSEFWKEKLE